MAAAKGTKEVNDLKQFVEEKKGLLELLQYGDNISSFVTAGIDGNCDYSYSSSANMFSFILEVSGTMYEGRSDRIEKLSQGDTVSIVRDPGNKYDSNCLAVQNAKGESLGNLNGEAAKVISPVMDKAGYKIGNAKVASLVRKSEKGAKAKKADLYVSFDLSTEKAKKTTAKTKKSTTPRSNKKAGDLISDFDYADTRFRGPGKEIDKLTAYIDGKLGTVKRVPYMRQEVGDGIDEVLIKGGAILDDTPNLVERFPQLKATGIYEYSRHWAVGVWFSGSGAPYPTEMDHAGGFDPKADGGEGRWVWENDMMDDVECSFEYIQTGDEEEISYSYPYEDLWNATDDYVSAPGGDEPTEDPPKKDKDEEKPKAKPRKKDDYLCDWTFDEGNTVRGEDFEIAVPDGFVAKLDVEDNDILTTIKRAFVIKPKDSLEMMDLMCGSRQSVNFPQWMVHPQANAGVCGVYSSMVMEQMVNLLNLDIECAYVTGWSDVAASIMAQNTGNSSRSYQIMVFMDDFNQQLRVQTGRLTKPKKEKLNASIIRWLHTMKFDNENPQIPDAPKIDNPKLITELKKGKTKLLEEAVDEARTEYVLANNGRYKIIDGVAQCGSISSYASDDIPKMLSNAMSVKEYFYGKIDKVLSSPELEDMDEKTMDKVRKCLEPLLEDVTEFTIQKKKIGIDLPESIIAFREKYSKTNSKRKPAAVKMTKEEETSALAKKATTTKKSTTSKPSSEDPVEVWKALIKKYQSKKNFVNSGSKIKREEFEKALWAASKCNADKKKEIMSHLYCVAEDLDESFRKEAIVELLETPLRDKKDDFEALLDRCKKRKNDTVIKELLDIYTEKKDWKTYEHICHRCYIDDKKHENKVKGYILMKDCGGTSDDIAIGKVLDEIQNGAMITDIESEISSLPSKGVKMCVFELATRALDKKEKDMDELFALAPYMDKAGTSAECDKLKDKLIDLISEPIFDKLKAEDYSGAEELSQKVLKLNPQNGAALYGLSVCEWNRDGKKNVLWKYPAFKKYLDEGDYVYSNKVHKAVSELMQNNKKRQLIQNSLDKNNEELKQLDELHKKLDAEYKNAGAQIDDERLENLGIGIKTTGISFFFLLLFSFLHTFFAILAVVDLVVCVGLIIPYANISKKNNEIVESNKEKIKREYNKNVARIKELQAENEQYKNTIDQEDKDNKAILEKIKRKDKKLIEAERKEAEKKRKREEESAKWNRERRKREAERRSRYSSSGSSYGRVAYVNTDNPTAVAVARALGGTVNTRSRSDYDNIESFGGGSRSHQDDVRRVARYLAINGSDEIGDYEFRRACLACGVDPSSITPGDAVEIQMMLNELT